MFLDFKGVKSFFEEGGVSVQRRPDTKLRPRKNMIYRPIGLHHLPCHIVYHKLSQNSQIAIKLWN